MSLRNIGIVYRKELTESLRDRRTVVTSILLPLLLFPLLTVGMVGLIGTLINKAKQETATIMIVGGQDSPRIVAELRKYRKVEVLPTAPDWKEQISNKTIRSVVEIPEGFQAALDRGESKTITISYYEGDIKSSFGADSLREFFNEYRDSVIRDRLTASHVPEAVLKPFEVKRENVAPPEKVSGATFGGLLVYMVILLCLTGSMAPAMDLTAGEKERGTIETILSSPVSRTHLVLGKFFMVLTAGLLTAALSVLSMGFSFWAIAARTHGAEAQFKVSPAAGAVVFLMALPVAFLFAAVLLTISLFAKSVKEAQTYIAPLIFVVIFPAFASILPGVELTAKLAVIPILNVSLVCKEIMTGTYHWNYIALIFASTCVYAAAAIFIAVKMFQREDVLFRS